MGEIRFYLCVFSLLSLNFINPEVGCGKYVGLYLRHKWRGGGFKKKRVNLNTKLLLPGKSPATFRLLLGRQGARCVQMDVALTFHFINNLSLWIRMVKN